MKKKVPADTGTKGKRHTVKFLIQDPANALVKRGATHGFKLVHGVVLIKVNQPDVTPQLTGDLLGFEITGIAAQYAGLLAGQPRRECVSGSSCLRCNGQTLAASGSSVFATAL